MSNENEGNICNKYDDVAAAIVKHDDDSFNDFPDLGGEARSLLASIYQRQAFRVGGVDPKAVDYLQIRRCKGKEDEAAGGGRRLVICLICHLAIVHCVVCFVAFLFVEYPFSSRHFELHTSLVLYFMILRS